MRCSRELAVGAFALIALGACIEGEGLEVDDKEEALTFSCFNDSEGDEICCTDGYTCFYMKEGAGGCTATRDAQTYAQAVGTLEDVEECIEQYVTDEGGSISEHIEVRIKKGTYDGEVTWSYYTPGYYTFFVPADYKYGGWGSFDERPVFDGEHARSFMMRFEKGPGTSIGEFTRLAFYYMDVRNYLDEGIVIYPRPGKCDGGLTELRWSGYNYFYGNYFYNIGRVNTGIPEEVSGQAGIFLCSSDYNRIINNHFVNLVNIGPPETAENIHAVYMKTNSNNNLVSSNTMTSISGSPIRVRDNSNDNDVRGNVLTDTGPVGLDAGGQMEEHYTEDPAIAPENECANHSTPFDGECPSWRNWFRYNYVGCGYNSSQDIPYWFYHGLVYLDENEDPLPPSQQQTQRAQCIPTECPNNGDDRLQTASNIDTCP